MQTSQMPYSSSAKVGTPNPSSFCNLCRTFAMQSSAHGLRKAATARTLYTRIFWAIVFLLALAGCAFHCLFLVQTYLSYPRMTITEEIHADDIAFPSLTVCNLNVLKKSYIDRQMDMLKGLEDTFRPNSTPDSLELDPTASCFGSVDEFLYRSKTLDLSDIWMSLTVTKESLQKFGHQESDLIVHCTYNARNCFNRRSYSDSQILQELIPISAKLLASSRISVVGETDDLKKLNHSIVLVNPYPSPRYGLCHTISVNQMSLQKVTRPGLSLGLRLTLNIQRDEYLDLLSPEYGARLLVHPPGTYPTLQRGGVVLQPGTKTYVSVRKRKIDRLPWPYGECTDDFENSPLSEHLVRTGQKDLLKDRIYTYEYCQTLCRDAYLLKQCDCSEEVTQGNSRFCDPCNATQARCRTNFLRTFNRNSRARECHQFCKPACSDIRYDLTVSRSEWPNERHHIYVLKRWPSSRSKFRPATPPNGTETMEEDQITMDVDYIRQNFLQVHVFIQEMNYLSVRDVPAYAISQLFADLGGCLGLYIGVSLITILEVFELFKSLASMIQRKWKCGIEPKKRSNHLSDLRWVEAVPNNPVRVIYRRDQCCPPANQKKPTAMVKNRNGIKTIHLAQGCISQMRQLPSPVFIKSYDNTSTVYPPY